MEQAGLKLPLSIHDVRDGDTTGIGDAKTTGSGVEPLLKRNLLFSTFASRFGFSCYYATLLLTVAKDKIVCNKNNPVEMSAKAACLSCSSRKRKCDRSYPVCGRCERYAVNPCEYPVLVCKLQLATVSPRWISSQMLMILSRLLLKCSYRATAIPAPPPSVASIAKTQKWHEQLLSDDLAHLDNAKESNFLLYLSDIITKHRQVLNGIVDSFLSSCQKWMPIFYEETFEQTSNQNQQQVRAQQSMLFLLAMCMITRPLVSGNDQPDALRECMYLITKRLFWDPSTIEKPTTVLMKAGLLLSVYEYGHGLLSASFMTISVCSSMAQVTKLGGVEYDYPGLPPFGTNPIKENDLKLWWSIKIHERSVRIHRQEKIFVLISVSTRRMISLKSGLTIRPLIINESEIMDNHCLRMEIEYVKPQLILDQHYVSFHLQARAAIWLDLVLDLVRSPVITTSSGRLRFEAVDQGLLQFLSVLFEFGMGVCCEAISISLK
jgi:Fungal Zn(2)-Cys(6) binuclear cluster domain/Fungal specific transcription factor domain